MSTQGTHEIKPLSRRATLRAGAVGAGLLGVSLIRPSLAHATDSGAVALAPDSSTRNVIQPVGDYVPLTIQGVSSGGRSDILAINCGPGNNYGLRINAHTHALYATHDTDWAGQTDGPTYDLVSLAHRSNGDAIFIVHQGGKVPGFTGTSGGNAALNVLIPYNIDGTGTGWDGTTLNTRTGQRGLFIQSQPTASDVLAILVAHYGQDYGVKIIAQRPGHPSGSGGPMMLHDYSPSSSLYILKQAAPTATSQDAALQIRGNTGSTLAALKIVDDAGSPNILMRTDGVVRTLATFQSFNGYEIWQDSAFARRLGRITRGVGPGGASMLTLVGESGRPVQIRPADSGTGALAINGLASQTGRLLEIRDSGNQVLHIIDPSGRTYWYASGSTPTLRADGPAGFFRGGGLSRYADSGAFLAWVDASDTLSLIQRNSANIAFIVKGAVGQSQSLLELQGSTNNILSRFDKNGYFMTRRVVEPADADLTKSEVAIWLDDTPGGTKVMFKAKDSAGTVRTAAVALT
jgi:hypothetical protein